MGQAHQGKFVQAGRSIDYTPGADVVGGDVVIQNNLVGVASLDIAASALGALAISGIFDMVKKQEAFATVGANLFWDATGDPYNGSAGTGALTATAAGNTWCGFVLETADATDETVRMLLRSTVTLTAESFSLADLSDIDAVAYTAGLLLVGTGTKFADVALSGPWNLSAAGLLSMDSATVAAAGSVQGDATALADGLSLVSAGDGTKGVILPAAAAGGFCIVKNNAASVLKLWPNTSDAIDALGGDNAMSMPAYAVRVLVAYDATTWYSDAIGTAEVVGAMIADNVIDSGHYVDGSVDAIHIEGLADGEILIGVDGTPANNAKVTLSGPFNLANDGTLAMDSATVAATGADQAGAAQLADGFSLVTAADATKGVKLPGATAGAVCIVKNEDSANAVLKLYPAVSDQINAVAVNGSLDMAAKTSVLLVAYDVTTWYTVPLLPS